eukprot:CAMPEP_0115512074 /NCGR_PEP_ID=MMETSP0271-20121206/74308_1 /TAXON_ID=71861 /ORGANISM="Scrippsiella trochoidea, Strain CCMP3099" /LENGTH=101 /DNA_ID=CAMNT_0002942193 /DNA_START=643 /DNA_END=948 /DNA_ORIENTATION=-
MTRFGTIRAAMLGAALPKEFAKAGNTLTRADVVVVPSSCVLRPTGGARCAAADTCNRGDILTWFRAVFAAMRVAAFPMKVTVLCGDALTSAGVVRQPSAQV